MSIEIEIKFRVPDPHAVRAQALALGASPAGEARHIDRYFAHPARDFAQTDEALRVRSTQDANHITYKGPKRGGPAKTREELEVAFEAGPEAERTLAQILERLGFRIVLTIAKQRRTHRLLHEGRAMIVALDDVEGLGSFAEVETIAQSEPDVPDAQQAVLDLAHALGLAVVEPRSYLRMALERVAGETSR